MGSKAEKQWEAKIRTTGGWGENDEWSYTMTTPSLFVQPLDPKDGRVKCYSSAVSARRAARRVLKRLNLVEVKT